MANKSKRFKKPAADSDSPGPAAYTLHKRADWIKEIGRSGVSSAPAATKEGSTQKGTVSYIPQMKIINAWYLHVEFICS